MYSVGFMNPDAIPDTSVDLLSQALARLKAEFAALPQAGLEGGMLSEDTAAMAGVLEETARRMGDNYPYFHPLYAGQMLKPPHPMARAAYAMALDQSQQPRSRRRSRQLAMETEAVREIAAMFGWDEHLGHLTSGGTFANLEALWMAGQLAPGKTIVASEQAHYTHARISSVLKLPFQSVATDVRGRMDVDALEEVLRRGGVGTVVVTTGNHSPRRGRSAGQDSRTAQPIWLPRARGRGLRRLFQAGVEPGRRCGASLRLHRRSGLDRRRPP